MLNKSERSKVSRRSARKGSTFERLIACLICKQTRVRSSECYRTPLSGGHPFGAAGDLVMSDRLLTVFPWVVECKHRKNWSLEVMMKAERAQEAKWFQQVERAVEKANEQRNLSDDSLSPMIVVRGNGTDIYAIVPAGHLMGFLKNVPKLTLARDDDYGQWVMLRFHSFLNHVKPLKS